MNLRHILLTAMALLSLAACKKEPVSATDRGTWNLDADKNAAIKPGDDFNLYCNGTWMNSVSDDALKSGGVVSFYDTEMPNALAQLLERYGFESPVEDKFGAHTLTSVGKDVERLKGILQEAVDKINAAQSKEALWVVVGQLMKAGYQVPFSPLPMQAGGKVSFMFSPGLDLEVQPMDFSSQTTAHAALLTKASAPVSRVDVVKWPMMVKVCEGLGVDPKNASLLFEEVDYTDPQKKENTQKTKQALLELQAKSLEESKAFFQKFIMNDLEFSTEVGKAAIAYLFLGYYGTFAMAYEKSYQFAKVVPASAYNSAFGEEVFRGLVTSFADRLDKNTWLSPASRAAAKEKVLAMRGIFRFPAADEFYTDCIPDLSDNNTLMEDVQSLREGLVALCVKLSGKPASEAAVHAICGYLMSLNNVNAGYVAKYNTFVCLPIWLMAPAYDPAANSAYNFAHLGCVVAHEMTHGFDTGGCLYDKDGNVGGLYASSADEAAFKALAQKLIAYHNGIELLPGLYADGAKTVDEDIADLGGFEIAFQAYTNYLDSHGFTGETKRAQQRKFYEAYAHMWRGKATDDAIRRTAGRDSHSLRFVRINSVVANTDAWYDLYNVQPGDKLYIAPEKRIHIW